MPKLTPARCRPRTHKYFVSPTQKRQSSKKSRLAYNPQPTSPLRPLLRVLIVQQRNNKLQEEHQDIQDRMAEKRKVGAGQVKQPTSISAQLSASPSFFGLGNQLWACVHPCMFCIAPLHGSCGSLFIHVNFRISPFGGKRQTNAHKRAHHTCVQVCTRTPLTSAEVSTLGGLG